MRAEVQLHMLELEDHVELVPFGSGEQDCLGDGDARHLADGEHVDVTAGENLAVHFLEELVVARTDGEVLIAGSVQRPGPRLGIRQGGVLADHIDDIHAETIDAAVQPPAHHREHRLANLGVLPVQVGLLTRENVQIVLAGLLIPGPGGAREVRLPVGGLGTRRPGRGARAGVPPPVPVPLGIVPAGPGLFEPRVLVGGVVHDQVDDQPHAARMELGDQLVQVGQRAEQRIDVLVVADVIAVVIHRRPVDRAHPDDVHTQALQVIQTAKHAPQISDAVAVGVGEAPRVDLIDDPASPVGCPLMTRGLRVLHCFC